MNDLDQLLNLNDEVKLVVDGIHVLIREIKFLDDQDENGNSGFHVDYVILQGEPKDKEAFADTIGQAVAGKIKQLMQEDIDGKSDRTDIRSISETY